MLKALIIGLGSIGRRHLQILAQMDDGKIICCRSGKGRVVPGFDAKHGVKTVNNLNQAIAEKPDFAIIANPTSLHVETALSLASAGIPFLIEKPVSDRLEGLDSLQRTVSEQSIPVMVSFQLRHHPGYKQLLQMINSGEIGKPLSLQGYVGQYLPEWRPNEDYRQSYSAKKDLGGGVILDLCHEIDIAISILGNVNKVSCLCDHYSDLQIETEDMADITMEHTSKTLSHVHLNYLERGYEWVTKVMGTLGTVIWDYRRGYVKIIRADSTSRRWNDPNGFERDWLFREQLKQWLEVLDGKTVPAVNLVEGIAVTKVALAAKRSSQEKRHIEV